VLGARIAVTVRAASEAGGEPAAHAVALQAAWDDVLRVTGALWEKGDPELALANASLYLEAFGHVVVAWLWLEQLGACGTREGLFYDGKRAAARFCYAFELPTIDPKLRLLESLDTTTLDLDPDVL
jgi:butyryl-CoA dehydrogenase